MTQRSGTAIWYFKRDVPKHLRASIGKTAIWIPLGSADKKVALLEYHEVAKRVEALFLAAENGVPTGTAYDALRRIRAGQFKKASEDLHTYVDASPLADAADFYPYPEQASHMAFDCKR